MRHILVFLAFAAAAFGQCGGLAINPVTGFLDCTGSGATVSTAFSVITSATNTQAAMVLSTGSSIAGTGTATSDWSAVSGSNAYKIPVAASVVTTVNGAIGYDSTTNMLHAAQSTADAMIPQFTATPANNDCVKWTVSGSNFKLNTAGSACGAAGVTSVGFTGGLISVATATTTPALTVAGTSGGVPYFSSASTWASSAALAANGVVLGGGAGATPTVTAADSTTTHALFATAGAPAFRALVTGDLPAALASQTSINGLNITASTGTFALANGKTLTASNTYTTTATDGSTVAFGTGGTVLYNSSQITQFAGNPQSSGPALSATNYIGPSSASWSGSIATRNWVATTAGTLKIFYFITTGTQSGTGGMVCSVYVNSVASALTVSVVASDTARTYSDLAHTVAISQGDLLTVGCVNSASATGATVGGWGIGLYP